MECSVLEMDVPTAHPVVLQAWDAALAMTIISTSSMTRFINITSIFVGQILLPNSTPIFQRTENIEYLGLPLNIYWRQRNK